MGKPATRITIIANNFPPETGAAAGRLWSMAQLLRQYGYHISVLTVLPNYPKGKIFPQYRSAFFHQEIMDGITVYRIRMLPTHSSKTWKRAFSMLSHMWALGTTGLLRLKQSKPDALIIQSPSFANGVMASLMGKWFTKAKIILNVSDLYPLTAAALGVMKKGFRYQWMEHHEKKMYQRADAFIVQSEEIQTHIKSQQSQKPILIYRHLKDTYAAKPYLIKHFPKTVVYAGLLGIAQDVLQICKEVNFRECGCELHIYGAGKQQQEIESFIKTHPHRGIYYKGHKTETDMVAILADYGALLIPLKAHIPGAVPSKLYSAAALGTPVLFMGAGEGADIVKKYGLGWVIPAGNFSLLKKSVQEFAQLPQADWQKMADRSKDLTETVWKKEHQDRNLLALLEKILQ